MFHVLNRTRENNGSIILCTLNCAPCIIYSVYRVYRLFAQISDVVICCDESSHVLGRHGNCSIAVGFVVTMQCSEGLVNCKCDDGVALTTGGRQYRIGFMWTSGHFTRIKNLWLEYLKPSGQRPDD
jgi:hypothetical protein